MAPLRCAAKFDPFFALDCAPTPSTLAQSKERKGSNFAIWQPCVPEGHAEERAPLQLRHQHLVADVERGACGGGGHHLRRRRPRWRRGYIRREALNFPSQPLIGPDGGTSVVA